MTTSWSRCLAGRFAIVASPVPEDPSCVEVYACDPQRADDPRAADKEDRAIKLGCVMRRPLSDDHTRKLVARAFGAVLVAVLKGAESEMLATEGLVLLSDDGEVN